jgi:acetyl-CoA acetyltransferase
VLAELRDTVAIVGVGATPFGELYRNTDPGRTATDLAVDAFRAALADAGLRKDEVDGLITSRVPHYGRMAVRLGLNNLRFVNQLEGGGRSSGVGVQWARLLIASGMAETVALLYGNDGRSAAMKYGGEDAGEEAQYDNVYGITSPGAAVGLAWRRYQHLYGAPDGALAPVAVNNRRNGALNPDAVLRKPITREDYLNSPFITEPLRRFDYCLINDGGVALILTSAERARTLAKPPIYITATAQATDLHQEYAGHDFFYGACAEVARRVYTAAGLGPADIDVAEIYDNFTPVVLWSLEGFGFAPRGESWRWAADGRIELDGELPVNTSGGHTAESYMQGWALHAEAVRQLRGESGERQVTGARIAQYICAAPIITSHILRTD